MREPTTIDEAGKMLKGAIDRLLDAIFGRDMLEPDGFCAWEGTEEGMSEVMRARRDDSTGIKPCPFCGYDECDVWYFAGFGSSQSAWVYCPQCDAQGPHESNTSDVRQTAVDAWNDRRLA